MSEYKIDLKQVRRDMSGRWLDVLPIIDNRLSVACASNGSPVPCPLGTSSDGFRIPLKAAADGHAYCGSESFTDGFSLLMWLTDKPFYEVLEMVNECINGGATDTTYRPPVKPTPKTDYSKRRKVFDMWVRESRIQPNAAAIKYYENRGLVGAESIRTGSLRYLDAMPYYHDGNYVTDANGGRLTTPAILCGMRSDKQVTGFSIIRIDDKGDKATEFITSAIREMGGNTAIPVQAKQLFTIRADIAGSCFRLGTPGREFFAGEGTETMMAVALAFGTRSVAAAGTCAMLGNLEVPEGVEVLRIFADKDMNGAGLKAAEKLAGRYSDKLEVIIHLPMSEIPSNKKGVDWLDCQSDLRLLAATHARQETGLCP